MPGFKLMVLLDRLEGVSFMASPETEATLADAAKFLEPPQLLLVDERVVLPPGA